MTSETLTTIMSNAVALTLIVSAPTLLCGLAVGVAISIFSAVTQIQEMTLTFVPKIVVVFLSLIFAMPWIIEKLSTYTINLFQMIPMLTR
ncbi:MAG: flagellar biosynthesis protein FliQ [Syntrophaceae bacterium]